MATVYATKVRMTTKPNLQNIQDINHAQDSSCTLFALTFRAIFSRSFESDIKIVEIYVRMCH